jgi:hypothetical protein
MIALAAGKVTSTNPSTTAVAQTRRLSAVENKLRQDS